MPSIAHLATTTLAIVVVGSAAYAADDRIDLATWDQTPLYDGWQAEKLIGSAVRDPDGNELGDIENFYVDDDGSVTRVIVEAGGLLDIGDTHLSVAWKDVGMGDESTSITVPVKADNVDAFSLFAEEPQPGAEEYRVTEFIGDYVYLSSGEGYGVVQDLIFDRAGKAQAVIVNPDITIARPGYYAYPYYGQRDPRAGVYDLPYTMREVEDLGPFDFDAMQG